MKVLRLREVGEPEDDVDIDEYLEKVSTDWSTLLKSNPDESLIQDFVERHPCLLPDPYNAFQRGHHGVMTGLVYSQPQLPGPRLLKPDFMYIAMDSSGIFPVLIEIETPGKKHATKSGQPSAPLTQARSQLTDWASWFDEPENQLQFRKTYRITDSMVRVRRLRPRYVLVYGRRIDAISNPRFAKTRANSRKHDTVEMTYDRLTPNRYSAGAPVVRPDFSVSGELSFRVHQVSPVPDSRLFSYIDMSNVVGLKEALDAQPAVSPERRAWLLRHAGSFVREEEERRREQAAAGELNDDDWYDDEGDED